MAEGVIAGGGSIAVASEELFAHAGIHRTLSEVVGELLVALTRIGRIVDYRGLVAGDGPMSAQLADQELEVAIARLRTVQCSAEVLPRLLELTAQHYGVAERVAEAGLDAVFDHTWWLGGLAVRTFLPGLVLAGVPLALLARQVPAEQWTQLGLAISREPGLAGVTGSVAEHADEAVAGFLGLPMFVSALFGGTAVTARLLGAAGRPFGLFTDSPVRVAAATPMPAPSPPASLTDAAMRIKSMEHTGAQVVVELYRKPDGIQVAQVYIDGTVDWSPVATTEPMDMSSNVNAVAQLDPVAGAEAVKLAMREAGVTADTPVQLVGFSQGGIQAALVARQEDFHVVGVTTIGAPIQGIAIDPSIPVLSIGHTEDPVFALADEPGPGVLSYVVQRFDDDHPMPPGMAAPGHQFAPYRQTLEQVDASAAPQLAERVSRLVAFTAGAASATSTAYRLERYEPQECTPWP